MFTLWKAFLGAWKSYLIYSMNRNGGYMAFTHIKHCGGVAGRNVLGTLLKFQSSPLNYFLLSGFQLSLLYATDRISEHTAPKYGTKPIRYVTLRFRDRCGAASLCHRNRAATTVLVCEQSLSGMISWRSKSYTVWTKKHVEKTTSLGQQNAWKSFLESRFFLFFFFLFYPTRVGRTTRMTIFLSAILTVFVGKITSKDWQ